MMEASRASHRRVAFVITSLTVCFLACAAVITPAAAKKGCVNCHQNSSDPYPSTAPPYDPTAGLSTAPLVGGTSSTLLQTGTENTTLQLGTQSTTLQAGVEREGGPINILFLIDSSQSMKEKISGSSDQRMDAAKRVLQETIAQMPAEISVGLRVFGQGFRNDPYSDCQQSALLVPVGRNNRRAIISQVRELRPYGLTPLTYGLMQAEQDLRYVTGPKTVILISDGAETCGGDPCAYIDRLATLGIKMKVDIVGLGLKRDHEAKAQLGCIAAKSGGKFYDANTAAELVDSITHSVRQALSGKIITKLKTDPTGSGLPTVDPSTITQPAGNNSPAPPPKQSGSPLEDLPADLKR